MLPYINVKPLRQMHSDIIVNGADGYRETPPSSTRYTSTLSECTLIARIYTSLVRSYKVIVEGTIDVISTVSIIPFYVDK